MGVQGLRVVRFRKRYYIYYHEFDSEPTDLGKQVAAEIPSDAAKYQQWLAVERKSAEEWETLYEDFLSIKPGNKVARGLPDFMRREHPSSLAPVNDDSIQFIYTVDLDREVFSVNNGAHFKLDQVPHIDWIGSLVNVGIGNTISLPGAVPMEAVTSLMVEHTFQSSELSKILSDPTVSETAAQVLQVVVPKNIKDIPWRQRHGPIMRRLMFYVWSHVTEGILAATLLQLSPEHLPFRDIAYAALCLAAGGKNVTVVSSEDVSTNGVFGFIQEGPKYNEFISVLASGAHLQSFPPGSSPEATIYWLGNVLVVLTAQLYRPGTADEGIAQVVRYCQKNHPAECVDAVLISIEHVVLIHVTPGEKVQHTAIMPLFNIENHLTMTADERYAKPYLEKIAAEDETFMVKETQKLRKARRERVLKDDGMNLFYGDDREYREDSEGDEDEEDSEGEEESALCATKVKGDVSSTFYALVHLFEAAAIKRMPLARVTDGLLPNEIYTHIIKHVTDMGTRESLMKVSRTFRRVCQEDLLVAEGLIVEPTDACRSCDEADGIPKWFEKYDLANGTQSQVKFKRAGGLFDRRGGASWKVAIGTGYGRKSLLAEVAFRLAKV